MSTFAALALALTSVGIYGLLSFQVARRTQEIGIRMSLGAQRASVLFMVVKQAALLAAIGIAFAIGGAIVFTRFLASLLSGVRATDPLTYALASVLLLAVALLASYIPAQRASKVDPLVALRYE
jgi:ABC-type antimicrobial peptide transport system permease subunit